MGIIITLIILNIGAVLFKEKTDTDSSFSFFMMMCIGLMMLYAGGMINMLRPAALVFFTLIILGYILSVIKNGVSGSVEAIKSYIDFPVILNNSFSFFMVLIYIIQKPYFYYWDEYSFWGPSAKFVKYFHKIYSSAPSTVNGMSGLPCGNSLLNYLITFFTKDFQDWYLLAAYAIFYIAIFAMVSSLVRKKTGSFPLTALTFITLFLSPFMSTFHSASANYGSLLYAYGTSMVDFNIAVAFLGAVAAYLMAPDKKWYLLPVMFLATIKNTSIFFSFLAVAVICCFVIFDRGECEFSFSKVIKTLIITVAAPIVVYVVWNVHLNWNTPTIIDSEFILKDPNPPQIEQSVNTETEKGDNSGATLLSIVVPSIRTDRYNEVLDDMSTMFLSESVTLFSKDKIMVLGLVLLGIITTVMAERKSRVAVGLVNLGLAVGCYVYAITISYFITFFADGMVEYPRYMTSYYFSWMLVTALLMAIHCKKEWLVCAVFTFATCITVVFIASVGVSRTVFAAPDNAYSTHIQIEEEMEKIKNVVKKGDSVYLISKDQDALTYLHYNYHFLPAFLGDTKNTGIDFSISFRESIDWNSERTYYHVASPQVYKKVIQSYFDYVYVVDPDAEVVNSYNSLFSDGMTIGTLYKVTENDVPMQEVVFDE